MPSIIPTVIDSEHTGYTINLDGKVYDVSVFNTDTLVDMPVLNSPWADTPVIIINGATV